MSDLISREAAIAIAANRESHARGETARACKGIAISLSMLPAAPAVKVKPLVWSGERNGINDIAITSALSSLGRYIIWNSLTVHRPNGQLMGPFDTLEAAKAAAQADYEARILSALEGGEA